VSIVDASRRMFLRHGETLTLKRAGQANIDVKAKRYSLTGVELAGAMDDAEFTIKISNAEIAASAAPTRYPRQGDSIGGYLIQSCDTRRVGESVALHILVVSGGHS
jgi:hypothetical protein